MPETIRPCRVLILGATSAIAEATARLLAARGAEMYLVARNQSRLRCVADDLEVRGAHVSGCETLDLNDFDRQDAMLQRAVSALGGLDIVLIAHGSLGDQQACEGCVQLTLNELSTNALSVIALATRIAEILVTQRAGTLAVISSVAADRGRRSNYIYGSAKAMITAFLSGLRQRLYPYGVTVTTIKPGFVDTPMTAAFTKGFLWAKPDSIATGIVRALDRRQAVVYLPAFWRPVMLAVRLIPERVFQRLSF